ncbi:putative bifunctional diguanylate cyclase/phosphodiesterase [Oceanirhabdus sp. W0125-5]|uniref:putative bifunctional diguanylate cyclase/phosphodiesterase n=1 Tax=Oceanirhabdus sp. W0125-5 TaxID=2999116 RepID=UPI0022F30663|nr:GGDEF and EAL domain-containing protein [Oceanirhabdus sp. W0125-5]WBW97129.1 GGDEF and EAL domain-containing protein [Oceanirhabdus sp. W0125-5]
MNRIKKNMYLAFLILIIPFIVTMMVASFTYIKIKDDGVAINLSGSQRMRTMLISNYSQQYVSAVEIEDSGKVKELKELLNIEIDIYERFTNALIYGDKELNISTNRNKEIVTYFDSILPLLNLYISNVEILLDYPDDYESLSFIIKNAMGLKNQIHEIVELYQIKYDRNINIFKILIILLIIVGIFLTAVSLHFIKKSTLKTLEKAYYDELTGLKNRTYLFDNMLNIIDEKIHCIYIDLDNFKDINDLYGHIAGDFVLVEVARRLKNIFGDEGVYRLGGDEFLVIIKCCGDSKQCSVCSIPKNKCELILEEIVQPIINNDRKEEYVVGCSIGFAKPDINKEISIERLIELSDVAMIKAKESGKNQYYIANEEFLSQYKESIRMKVSLNNAIENNEIIPYYQPIIDINTKEIKGIETLVRWKKDNEIVPPYKFIKLAETSGKIYNIDLLMLRKGIELYQELKLSNSVCEEFIISSNFSPYTLSKVKINELLKYIDNLGVKPENVEIEITEEMIVESVQYNKVSKLSELGFKIAIDDFSAGHSSLKYLNGIDFSVVKLDRSLLPVSKKHTKESIIYKTIVNLASDLKIDIISEGVETEEQVKFLKNLGVKKVQGYYYSKPVSGEKIKNMICVDKIIGGQN